MTRCAACMSEISAELGVCEVCSTPSPRITSHETPPNRGALAAGVDQMKAELAIKVERSAGDVAATASSSTSPSSSASSHAGEPEIDIQDVKLAQLGHSGYVVGLLGFPEAGKTWFLNRLKSVCENYGMEAHPRKALNRSEVRGTRVVSAHDFLSQTSPAFSLIDIAGEQFERAITGNFLNQEKLLRVVQACDAFIVLLPADEALFSEMAAEHFVGQEIQLPSQAEQRARMESELHLATLRAAVNEITAQPATGVRKQAAANRRREELLREAASIEEKHKAQDRLLLASADERLTRFIDGIGYMAGVVSLLESGRTVESLAAATDDDVTTHLKKGFTPSSKPIFIAMSKADRLEAPSDMLRELVQGDVQRMEILERFADDPIETLRMFRPNMVDKFEKWFRWSKVDFVTAFGDHKGGHRIEYRACYHIGVEAVMAWIHWARDSQRWKKADWADLAMARTLRQLRDHGLRGQPKFGASR